MGTKRKINANIQVKELNNKRWICERVLMTETTTSGDYDFMDNADSSLWKKIRPWKKGDIIDDSIAGQSQVQDDNYPGT